MEDERYKSGIPTIELLGDRELQFDPTRPTPVTYGCCSDLCSLKSFAWWLVAGKVYRK